MKISKWYKIYIRQGKEQESKEQPCPLHIEYNLNEERPQPLNPQLQ